MSDLRAIGSRAFVHIKTHTTKLGDKAWEGKLCGFSQNSWAYRIYHPAKVTVVESRNVTFLETPPYSHLPTKGLDYVDNDEEAYARDVIDYTSFPPPSFSTTRRRLLQLKWSTYMRGFET